MMSMDFLALKKFYDNLISSGTKIIPIARVLEAVFYDNLISSGTKMHI